MKQKNSLLTYIVAITLFISFASFFYFIEAPIEEVDKIFLSMATFLFAIFTGFFISRQGRRYSILREKIANLDGHFSSIYRGAGQFDGELQTKIVTIVTNYYRTIKEHAAWDYMLLHKSTTITDIHTVLKKELGESTISPLQNAAVGQIFVSLRELQSIRKILITLHQERVPTAQWALIYFLSTILVTALFTIPSLHMFLDATLKAAFVMAVFAVLLLLNQLDRLQLFETVIGEKSAQDAIDIIEGVR